MRALPFGRDAWILDMDGTLTVAIHDFEALRLALGLPKGAPIVEQLAAMPGEAAAPLRARLWEIELDLARRARPAPGAHALLDGLARHGARLGVLTRNARDLARLTLEAAGLRDYFEDGHILGRDEAAPKPAPDGVRALLAAWGCGPERGVMVGDYLFDLQAGRAAGVWTVLLDEAGHDKWPDWADARVSHLAAIWEGAP